MNQLFDNIKITKDLLNKIINNYNNNNNKLIKIIYDNINDYHLKNYFYDNFLDLCIFHVDFDNLQYLYNDKHKWLKSSLKQFIKSLENNHNNNFNDYIKIFKFMIDNNIVLEEYLFKLIYDNYNKSFNNYNINLDSIYQKIIIICLDYIFNSNNNFIIDNNEVNEYYIDLLQYTELITDLEFFNIHRQMLLIQNENILRLNVFNKHKIIKHIIDKKYYNKYNCLKDYIQSYCDSIEYYNDNIKKKYNGVNIKLNIIQDDKYDDIFISLKNYLIQNYDNTIYFVKKYNVYRDIIYFHLTKIDYDCFKYIILDSLFDKDLFLNFLKEDYSYLFDLINTNNYFNNYILDFLLDYLYDYTNNDLIHINDRLLNKIINNIIRCIDYNYKVLFDIKYQNIFKMKFFDRVNYHIIKKKYYITDNKNIYLVKKLLNVILTINDPHKIYINFMDSVIKI